MIEEIFWSKKSSQNLFRHYIKPQYSIKWIHLSNEHNVPIKSYFKTPLNGPIYIFYLDKDGNKLEKVKRRLIELEQ